MAHVTTAEEKNETGLSLEVIGGMIWFFDFLILFFLPAGLKLGHQAGFAAVMGGLGLLGLVLVASGIWVRMKAKRLPS